MMKTKFKENLLNQPIVDLPVSDEFKEVTARYGYHTLADLLQLEKPYDALQHEGFGYRMLAEFAHVLADHGLGHYLN